MAEKIRIKDIAERAGVSVGTVDRVLHDRPNVSEPARKKVEQALKEMNYQPNMYASALAYNKQYTFYMLLPKHESEAYWEEIEEGHENARTPGETSTSTWKSVSSNAPAMSRSVRKPARSYRLSPKVSLSFHLHSMSHESSPTNCTSRTFPSFFSTPTCPTSSPCRSTDRTLSAADILQPRC